MTLMSAIVVVGWVYLALWASITRATGLMISWYGVIIVYLGCAFAAIFGSGHSERGQLSEERREFLMASACWLLLVSPILAYYFPEARYYVGMLWVLWAMFKSNYIPRPHQNTYRGQLVLAFQLLVSLSVALVFQLISPHLQVLGTVWLTVWFIATVVVVFGPSARYHWQTRQINQDVQRAQADIKGHHAA